jgi:O-antigen ligase
MLHPSGADVTIASTDPFEAVARRDPIGHAIHTLIAALYCFAVALVQGAEAVAIILLLACAVIRLWATWRLYAALLRQPLAIAFIAWSAWLALSGAWSVDPEQALDEIRDYRVLFVVGAIWPVLDRVGLYVAALLIGVLTQNVAQVVQLIRGEWQAGGIFRVRGFLHPIQTGALCAAAIVWHLGPAMLARGWWRFASIAGLIAAGGGLVLTGSRGPWLSAMVSVPLAVVCVAWRFRRARRPAIVLAIASLVAAASVGLTASEQVSRRVRSAIDEVAAASEGSYASDVGGRIFSWERSWAIFRDHPLAGAGAGSYQAIVLKTPEYADVVARSPGTPPSYFAQGHPHSTYFHALAATGAIGAGLFGMTVLLLLRNALRDRPDHAYAPLHACVLIGWLIGAAFDCYNLNAHLFGVFALLITFTLRNRPPLNAPAPVIRE